MKSTVVDYEVIPVAGRDSMLLNLSGAHAPYFTRTVLIVHDSEGRRGVSEVPGGEAIRRGIVRAADRIVGSQVAERRSLVRAIVDGFSADDRAGRGQQTFDQRTGVHVATAWEAALLDLEGQCVGLPVSALLGEGRFRDRVEALGYLFFIGDHTGSGLEYPCESAEPGSWEDLRRQPVLDADGVVALAKAAQARYGFRSFKLKGGVLAPDAEAEVIESISNAVPDARLTLDPNGSWLLEQALPIGRRLKNVVDYLEDPVGAEGRFSGREVMAEFRRATGVPTATNMIATDWRELSHAVRSDSTDIVLADPHFWTLEGSVRVGQLCRDFGVRWGSHSNNHFDISLAMFSHVAAAVPGDPTPVDTHWIWQDGQYLTKEPLKIRDGYVQVPRAPGLGIELDDDALREAHELYLEHVDTAMRDDSVAMRALVPDWTFRPNLPSLLPR